VGTLYDLMTGDLAAVGFLHASPGDLCLSETTCR
jgi:hypothetical protein